LGYSPLDTFRLRIMTENRAAAMVLARARQFLFVREAPGNKNLGRWVEGIQRIGGTVPGQPWCACFTGFILGLWHDNKPPLKYTASCDLMLEEARAKGMLRDDPAPGALFFLLRAKHDAIHVGFVTEGITPLTFGTIEGNASDPSRPPTREGWGVFERLVTSSRARKRGAAYVYAYWWLGE